MVTTYFIKTFGCAQNVADSQRIAAAYKARGMKVAKNMYKADHVIINTCMIREMAENRVYGTVNNLATSKLKTGLPAKIIITGCMVGMAVRDKTGKFLSLIRKRMPEIDEFMPIEEVGFDYTPVQADTFNAWVPISNGCNNFCTFCVVPFTRGREISRPYEEVIHECLHLAKKGYKKITLLGMNVNSYGADLIMGKDNIQVLRDIDRQYFNNEKIKNKNEKLQLKIKNLDLSENFKLKIENYNKKPVYVKHLGRYRIPTLFPYLLGDVCKIDGIETIDFMSSNPWDFSDELIDVIASNAKITRRIHLPVQSGSNTVLRRMNRWYSRENYLTLIKKMRKKIKNVEFSTDIIVGFCGETEKEFHQTVDLAKQVGFYKAYIAMYSDRPITAAHTAFHDDIAHPDKKRRWQALEDLINKPYLKKMKNNNIKPNHDKTIGN